jgi:hypothetical protein
MFIVTIDLTLKYYFEKAEKSSLISFIIIKKLPKFLPYFSSCGRRTEWKSRGRAVPHHRRRLLPLMKVMRSDESKFYILSATNKMLVCDFPSSSISTMDLPNGVESDDTRRSFLLSRGDGSAIFLIHVKGSLLRVFHCRTGGDDSGKWSPVNICLRKVCTNLGIAAWKDMMMLVLRFTLLGTVPSLCYWRCLLRHRLICNQTLRVSVAPAIPILPCCVHFQTTPCALLRNLPSVHGCPTLPAPSQQAPAPFARRQSSPNPCRDGGHSSPKSANPLHNVVARRQSSPNPCRDWRPQLTQVCQPSTQCRCHVSRQDKGRNSSRGNPVGAAPPAQ